MHFLLKTVSRGTPVGGFKRLRTTPLRLSLCINGTIKFSNISENDAVVDFAITVQTWGKLGKKLNFKAGIQRFVIIQVVFNFPPTASIFKRKAIFYF